MGSRKGGLDFFFEVKKWGLILFLEPEMWGQGFFFRLKKWGRILFLTREIGGRILFWTVKIPKTRQGYPVNLGQSLTKNNGTIEFISFLSEHPNERTKGKL